MIVFFPRQNTFNLTGLRIFVALLLISAPLLLPSTMNSSYHPTCIIRHFRLWCGRATKFIRSRRSSREKLVHYMSPEEEERYWELALAGKKCLAASNARFTIDADMSTTPPLIMSYSPALLPEYREKSAPNGLDTGEYYLSARSFCKWHRMVFPGPIHPTLQQASKLRKNFSNRDLQVMFRISRMLSDEKVFGRNYKWTPQYRDIWRGWVEGRGPDVAIIFGQT